MNTSTEVPSQPARILSAPGWATRSALGTMLATSIALAAFVAIGLISWAAVRGLQGVVICGALGATAGTALRGPGSRLARVLGGAIGGAIGGFFALASAELIPPGTIQWALGGGGYAALYALPAAAFFGGLIGLLRRPRIRGDDEDDRRKWT
jgi:hypothetical protein